MNYIPKNQTNSTRWNSKTKKEFCEWLEQGSPKSKEEMAVHLEMSGRTFATWINSNSEFREIVEKHTEKKKVELVNAALNGKIQHHIFQFLMKCNYGYMEESSRVALEIKRDELNAKLNGSIDANASQPIQINFSVKEKSEIAIDENEIEG